MSASQALAFAARYPTVVTFFDDTNSGLQVAVFKDTVDDAPGNVTVALRGTTLPEDLPAGVEIGGAGAAYGQIVAMVNWWNRASGAPGQMVNQFRLTEIQNHLIPSGAVVLRPGAMPDTSYVLDVMPQVAAFTDERNISSTLAADPDGKVDVAGHSLGGHLSLAFSSLFSSVTGQVTVFNAPGFKDNPTNRSFFTKLKLGSGIPTNADGNVVNVAADESLTDSNPFNYIAGLHSRPGEQVNIAIEKQTNSDEPNPFPALNHSIVALADSLAVYKLLADLFPTLSQENYKLILNQAAMFTAAGYERVVDTVKSVLGFNDVPLSMGNSKREELYRAIYDLRSRSEYSSRLGQLQIVRTTDNAATLMTQVQGSDPSAIAYRFALRELNPFVVIDAGGTGLYARFQTAGANAGELDFYDASNNPQGLTQNYLEDREGTTGSGLANCIKVSAKSFGESRRLSRTFLDAGEGMTERGDIAPEGLGERGEWGRLSLERKPGDQRARLRGLPRPAGGEEILFKTTKGSGLES
jgi:pimeloyl-ACP methyl ester carboxylesterase